MLYRFFLFFTFLVFSLSFAQTKNDSLILNSGYIDPKYFPINDLTLSLDNNKINVKDVEKLKYPIAFRFKIKGESRLRSEFLFIDERDSLLTVDYNINTCSNSNNDGVNNEYINRFVPYYYHIKNEKCSPINSSKIYEDNNDDDINLQLYIKNNPDSFVALWHLIEQISFNGYNIEREKSKNLFSTKIKKSDPWKILNEDIKYLKSYSIGSYFPKFEIKNFDLSTVSIKLPKKKYILIDIWTSSCMPCIKSFPQLKTIYSLYSEKGFEIIGLSADSTNKIPSWKKIIEKNSLPWINYLDENAKETMKRNIKKYPTTFLLNSEGKILQKDVSLEELEKFLKENLKK